MMACYTQERYPNVHEYAESLHGVEVTLKNLELWRQFYEAVTEMVITKGGRRMFPPLNLQLSGMDPEASYTLIMDFELVSEFRYKYSGNKWVAAGRSEPQPWLQRPFYIHPESPAKGSYWMKQAVSMYKAKLTNDPQNIKGNVLLHSMHKYIPRVHVVKALEPYDMYRMYKTFSFKETEFIAVTAYQNERITKLKIDNNPFARGFRENGLSRIKRKQQKEQHNENKDNLERRRSCSEQASCGTEDSDHSSLPLSPPCVHTSVPDSEEHKTSFVPVRPWEYEHPVPSKKCYCHPNHVPYSYINPYELSRFSAHNNFSSHSNLLHPHWPTPHPTFFSNELSNWNLVSAEQFPETALDLSKHRNENFVKTEHVPETEEKRYFSSDHIRKS